MPEAATAPAQPVILSELASYLTTQWTKALRDKGPFNEQMLANLRAFNSQYDPQKLAEIKQLGGSEVYIALTQTKVNATVSWLLDMVFSDDEPWDVEPTPIPELPPDVQQRITEQVMKESLWILQQYYVATGEPMESLMFKYAIPLQEKIKDNMYRYASEAVTQLKRKMKDQLVEGGWYKALKEVIIDLVIYKAAILKGPCLRKEKYFSREFNPATGQYENTIKEKIIPTWSRVSPFNIFPLAGVTRMWEGGFFELAYTTPKKLMALIGVPGYDVNAIYRILSTYRAGMFPKKWATSVSPSTETIKQAEQGLSYIYDDHDDIEMLIFQGSLPGDLLLRSRVSLGIAIDPNLQYDVSVYRVGDEIIRAMVNPDPMGRTPYAKACYIERPGSFWGDGLPELIDDLQAVCNATARSIVNNSGIASGPLMEINAEKIEPGTDTTIYPWKKIFTNDVGMTGAPAIRFYQPELVADALMRVFDYFSKLADQYSVPSYAHGDMNVGGAGNTASGLSMLMSSANRIIKNVVQNLDRLIADSIELLYFYDLTYEDLSEFMVGDVRIVAKGSKVLLSKEQQAVRRTEFLAATNNPTDIQIIGLDGRREMLQEQASALDFKSIDKIFPLRDQFEELKQKAMGMLVQAEEEAAAAAASARPEASKKTDAAGNIQSGQDFRLLLQKGMPQMRPNMGKNE